jgi:hypothetical protein
MCAHEQSYGGPLLALVLPDVRCAVLATGDEAQALVGPLDAVDAVRVRLRLKDAVRPLVTEHHVDAHVVVRRAGRQEAAARAVRRADHLRLAGAHALVERHRLRSGHEGTMCQAKAERDWQDKVNLWMR